MAESITVIARFRAAKGAERELRELLLSLIEPSRSDQGCVSYDLHQGLQDPTLFVFYETWENKELLSSHSATAHVRQLRSQSKTLLAEPPEVSLLTKIS
ncbi:MAG: putative quinol monooxygenase [Syntrophobacteraceae bacterium]|nr:putative quinol monooxygenase [Syntrophobacteraceae bacterium]